MLTPDNKIFLIDFGIARSFTRDKARDTVPLGSPGYAPPEQYGRAQTSPRSDIYSLGATLQTLLTGRDPLELGEGEPSLNPTPVSPRFRKLLNKMLSTEPSRRPKDMKQVISHLEELPASPTLLFMMGIIYGCALSLLGLLGYLLPTNVRIWIGFLNVGLAIIPEQGIRHILKLPPNVYNRYWWFGLLTWTLFIAIIGVLASTVFGWS